MAANGQLAAAMDELGYTQSDLARRVNEEIELLTGRHGNCTDSDVRRWLSGRTKWPQDKQRLSLENVFGRSATGLGFVPRGSSRPAPSAPPEDPVHRRTFLTAATGSTLAAASTLAVGSRIGMGDVERFGKRLDELVAADDLTGGHSGTEQRALDHARQILDLQQNATASQRVRSKLYFLASAFTSTAMWAAIDARHNIRAQQHLEKAVTLAGLSGDPLIQHRIWGHACLLAMQQQRCADAVAAGEAARNLCISRRNPLFGALAQARLAGAYARAGQRGQALRTMGHAQQAFERTGGGEGRPSWMAFFDRAEMEGLSALVDLDLGRTERAESHLHHVMALIRPELQRNRAYYTCKLALAQLRQREAELACVTARGVTDITPQAASSGRVRKLLGTFGQELLSVAPDAAATREWAEYYRTTKREGHT